MNEGQSVTTGKLPDSPLYDELNAVNSVEELDVPSSIVIDIIMRVLFNEGEVGIKRLSQLIKLGSMVIDEIVTKLQHDQLMTVASAGQMGRFSYTYTLTDEGTKRAREAMERSQYIGPAPVPVEKYTKLILMQSNQKIEINEEQVKEALSNLILPKNFHRSIGPAVASGSSIFLYGPPGNGKTTVAEAIAKLLGDAGGIWVPYAVTVAGHIVNIYDPLLFKPIELSHEEERHIDKRWGKWVRPSVMVGGELTMDALELRYDPLAKFYESPLQMKANGGMFLIDDFGRQMMEPQELLNRWIVPLETEIDFLRLRTGQALEVPFRQLIVFSTNLDPMELVDGAFLRRIQMKVQVPRPDDRMFFQIFGIMANSLDVALEKEGYLHLVQKWYKDTGRRMEAVHPRDLLKIIKSICSYTGETPRLTPALVDEACTNYFVDDDAAKDW